MGHDSVEEENGLLETGSESGYFYAPGSPEFLKPRHDADTRKTNSIYFVSSLVSTMLGGGVLSLPWVIACCGAVFGSALLVLGAIANDFSLYLLLAASRRSGGPTYESVARRAFGPKAQFGVVFLLFVMTFLCIVGYTVLLADLLTPLLRFALGSSYDDPWFHDLGTDWQRRLVMFGVSSCLTTVLPQKS
jgi:amino acid permease